MNDTTVVLLCLGAAVRMQPLSLNCPKSMLEFCLLPLLDNILDQLIAHGFRNIVIAANQYDEHFDHYVEWGPSYGVHIRVTRHNLMLGSAGVLREIYSELFVAGQETTDHFLVIYADSLLQVDFTSFWSAHQHNMSHGAIITMAFHEPDDLINPSLSTTSYGLLTMSDDLCINRFVEKPPVSAIFSSYASCGIFFIHWCKFVALLPYRYPLDLSRDIIEPLVLDQRRLVWGFPITPGYRYDIGTPDSYLSRQLQVLQGIISTPSTRLANHIRQHLISARNSVTIAGENCIIRPDVDLRGYIVLGDGVQVGNRCTIENSVLMAGACLEGNNVLRNVVIGRQSRLGSQVSLSNGTVIGPHSVVHSNIAIY